VSRKEQANEKAGLGGTYIQIGGTGKNRERQRTVQLGVSQKNGKGHQNTLSIKSAKPSKKVRFLLGVRGTAELRGTEVPGV